MQNQSNSTLYIIIPAYNEAENIEKVVNDWYRVLTTHSGNGRSRLVVVNDGSTDATPDILERMRADMPLLVLLTKKNAGHGPAVLTGYRYAVRCKADWIFQTDSDGQTDPAEFEKFWARREQYEALFGCRGKRGDGRGRAFVERVLCFVLFLIFGTAVPDANAPFRLMRSSYVKRYLSEMPRDYNLPNAMLTTFGAYCGDRIAFIKISFRPRRGGTNSIRFRKIIRIGIQSLRDFRMIKRRIDR